MRVPPLICSSLKLFTARCYGEVASKPIFHFRLRIIESLKYVVLEDLCGITSIVSNSHGALNEDSIYVVLKRTPEPPDVNVRDKELLDGILKDKGCNSINS